MIFKGVSKGVSRGSADRGSVFCRSPENPKTAHKNAQKRSENFKPCIHNFVSAEINLTKYGFLCVLMALFGSQGIVVKCTAAIFFRTVDCH